MTARAIARWDVWTLVLEGFAISSAQRDTMTAAVHSSSSSSSSNTNHVSDSALHSMLLTALTAIAPPPHFAPAWAAGESASASSSPAAVDGFHMQDKAANGTNTESEEGEEGEGDDWSAAQRRARRRGVMRAFAARAERAWLSGMCGFEQVLKLQLFLILKYRYLFFITRLCYFDEF